MDASMLAQLQAGLAQRDQLIAQLLEKVSAIELQTKATNANPSPEGSNKVPTNSGKPQTKSGATQKKSKKAGKKKAQDPPAAKPQASSKPPTNLGSSKKTPVKQRARSATPASASKKSPLQMVKQDHPAGFEMTKAKTSSSQYPIGRPSIFILSKVSSTDQINSAIEQGPRLVALDTIQTLKEARQERTKLGKHMMHISDFNIRYVHTSLSQLGLSAWIPNLDEQPDSLYNEAHKICAIRTFRQLVVGGAYKYMNINNVYVDDFDLLKQAYDHYVHYLLANVLKKEKKEQGKHKNDEERKVLQTARERLRDKRYKFAINNNFPKRYTTIIKSIQAHSDDEYYPSKNVYIVKKLPFRSRAANIFFTRLDDVMKRSALEEGKRDQGRRRIRVQDAPMTLFPKAPKGMPLDFYDAEWYNSKLPAQRQDLANIDVVAFLKNPNNSLRFKDAAEKMGDKRFSEERWDEATKEYNLDFRIHEETESGSENDDDGDGTSIDLEHTSGGEDEEEDEEYEEEDDDEEDDDEQDDDVQMREGCSRDVDENYEEYDDEGETRLAHYGKGTYNGGLADSEWNAWQ
ncbi:hypothetical protein PGTUg99_032904 [Puccinia graminis f. sp. tritici]|uniref:Uncharacterized protein n=1 Tax=Puccinia graminis f. sp. tritici TaxID=56615 RepID=A0A5B0SEL2_PUCGR|nr:hypothetical protein PGTUg99_032904 [Puccinia graminis f. sp. tritici]